MTLKAPILFCLPPLAFVLELGGDSGILDSSSGIPSQLPGLSNYDLSTLSSFYLE